MTSAGTLLEVTGLQAGYGPVRILENVALTIGRGAFVALVGANGAGKSTLLRALSGLVRPTAGRIVFDGEDLTSALPDRVVAVGIVHVAEGRRLFRTQSVADNLDMGLYGTKLSRADEKVRVDEALAMFPILQEKLHLQAGTLSGGQQQMLAIAQVLVRHPRLLLLDEPSLGLAPVVVDQVFDVLAKLHQGGVTILLVEQMVDKALALAQSGYVMQNGRIVGSGSAAELISSDMVRRAYLGAAEAAR
jgi:branched-chain amino acid transport system ATP-binding protein